jgi:glycerol-3-phosphate dehydrogenase
MSGIIKNVLLLFNEKFCQEAFLDDYINCLKKGSRNQKFSKLFYKDHKNIEHIKKELGLIEGLEISKQILKDKWLDW